MRINEGGYDRLLRVVIGFGLATMVLWGDVTGPARWVVLALAGVALVTAVTGYCPLYRLLGIQTVRGSRA